MTLLEGRQQLLLNKQELTTAHERLAHTQRVNDLVNDHDILMNRMKAVSAKGLAMAVSKWFSSWATNRTQQVFNIWNRAVRQMVMVQQRQRGDGYEQLVHDYKESVAAHERS